MKSLICPGCHSKLILRNLKKETRFRGVHIVYEAEVYVCPVCGLEAGTVESAGAVQRAIADAFREQMNLLTGKQIQSFRESKGLARHQLADLLKLEPVQIKRWESGLIQSRRLDNRLRTILIGRNEPSFT